MKYLDRTELNNSQNGASIDAAEENNPKSAYIFYVPAGESLPIEVLRAECEGEISESVRIAAHDGELESFAASNSEIIKIIELPKLGRWMLEYGIAECDLAIGGDDDILATTNR